MSTRDLGVELEAVKAEAEDVDRKIGELRKHRRSLAEKQAKLEAALSRRVESVGSEEAWEAETQSWSADLRARLKSDFRLNAFRPLQLSTMNAVLAGEDVLCIMSTGAGKSLCFQLPALLRPGLTLVISPLVALMEDQVGALKRLGVPAAQLHSATPKDEAAAVNAALTEGGSALRLLYVTPERVAKSKRFFAKLEKVATAGRLRLIAIDEVHCCSQWGHDFRPDYKFLNVLRRQFPKVPILGLTATATAAVLDDVKEMLGIPGALVFRSGFNRPNLRYSVRAKPKEKAALAAALSRLALEEFRGQSGIVYALTRKETEELATALCEAGVKAGCYHADMTAQARSRTHERWLNGRLQVVVATVAFGMGIDKADVRWVAHSGLAKSLENYYQESGRAGRDGAPADCILFFRIQDLFRISTMVCTERTGIPKLYPLCEYALGATRCRRLAIAAHFEEPWEEGWCQGMCDVCEAAAETSSVDVTEAARQLVALAADSVSRKAKLTGPKLLETWAKGSGKGMRHGEAILGRCVLDGWLREDFHFTPYSVISYAVPGPKAELGDCLCIRVRKSSDTTAGRGQKRKAAEALEARPSAAMESELSVGLEF